MALAVTTTTAATLFSALTLGGKENRVQLKHRVVMALLTRVRSGDSGVPTDVVKLYYSQRATDGGLQITEATNISATARGYFGAPGLFRQDQVEADGVAHHFRGIYNGVLIAAAGFDRVDAIRAVEDGTTDLVAFGRYFISNPDLVERLRTDADLNAFDSNTFYVQPDMTVETGYTDYPFLGEEVRSA
ncbi:hypothetical protein JG688_00009796 [Phytophthora aleatoria]|uniref:NADH:flavin oxidoreductase/NADH oxidase N-terminal domain-containing protein n=1 Tax=Phytophthora aleatoria TaxID=2496075 RepID=A0A8J5IKJ0_9STRA|nr:hypothetical protein JG688_00009796 [Phytophthora aleatoria]